MRGELVVSPQRSRDHPAVASRSTDAVSVSISCNFHCPINGQQNRNWDNKQPCLTPVLISNGRERSPLCRTPLVMPLYDLLIMLIYFSEIP